MEPNEGTMYYNSDFDKYLLFVCASNGRRRHTATTTAQPTCLSHSFSFIDYVRMSDALSERILSSTTFDLVFLMRAEIVCRYTVHTILFNERSSTNEENDSPFCHIVTHSDCQERTQMLRFRRFERVLGPAFRSIRRVECLTVGNTSANALRECTYTYTCTYIIQIFG